MRQEERKERSRNLIIKAAMEEFASSGYGAASIEIICNRHGISKGMMYHYFHGKDELFLECVRQISLSLAEHVRARIDSLDRDNPSAAIAGFFLLREAFFKDRPVEMRIYEEALIHPPKSLENDIDRIREPLKELNWSFVRSAVRQLPLRDGISEDMATRYINSIIPTFRTILTSYSSQDDLHGILDSTGRLLDMLLFGIGRA